MSICLCNLSADVVLELAAQQKLEIEPASPDPSSFSVDIALAERSLRGIVDKIPSPIELMVGSAKSRRRARGVSCHVWRGHLPKNSFFALDEGVYVTSPELALVQQASQLHQVSLCKMLGRYLGTWTPANNERGQDERAPLTSFEVLNDYVQSLGHVPGKTNLKLAMAYTCEGAASAPETSLQLALCLPPELCGLNILQPTMNYEVDLSAEAQIMYPRDTIRIDLCWPQEWFGLEYQGEEHGKQLGEDCSRWFAAREMGYELWLLAKEQLESATRMKHIAREVAKRINFDVDEAAWPTDSEFQDLLDILVGKKNPKPIGAKELRRRQAGRWA